MLRRTMFRGGVVLLALAGLVHGQDNRPRIGFGGQGPGFGGFGMGSAGLLAMPEVQKELGITDEQKGLIDDMMADLREQGRNAFGNFNPQEFQNLSQEERQKRMEEGRKRGEEMAKKTEEMVSMILEPKQVDRLQQLRYQQENVRAFNRDEVAKKLELSQEQRDKIRKLQEAARPQPGAFPDFRNMSEDERGEFFRKMREQAEKTNTEILNVLTASQKETWAKMQGKKFEFPAFQGFGARRPGGER